MEIYDHLTFRMAGQQFDRATDHLQIPEADRDRITHPKHAIELPYPFTAASASSASTKPNAPPACSREPGLFRRIRS